MANYYLGLDQGTTGTTAILFDQNWRQVSRGYREIRQIYPQAGWVEHDAMDIWESARFATQQALDKAGATGSDILCVGIDHEGESVIRNYIGGRDIDGLLEVSGELLPYMLHGTGDLFASAMLAALMCGQTMGDSVSFASGFVRDAMAITREQPNFELRGVSFESELGKVAALLG